VEEPILGDKQLEESQSKIRIKGQRHLRVQEKWKNSWGSMNKTHQMEF